MSVLSALLARDRVVPPQKIDEAIQRQVINGGDFETNLLEVGAVLEDTLASYCAVVHDAEPITRDEVIAADATAIARVARDVAESHHMLPIRSEHGKLVVATAVPLDAETLTTLERAFGPIDARITTPFRIAWGLWKFYGTELSPRLQRLAARLEKRGSGQLAAVARSTPSKPPKHTEPTGPQPKIRPSVLAALQAALTEDRETSATDTVHAEPPPAPVAPPTAPAEPAPLTLAAARALIEAATDRDGIVQTLLRYAAEQTAYSAVFVIHGDVAEGLDARGRGMTGETVRGLAVPLDAPGSFRTVRDRGEPVIGTMNDNGTDRVIRIDLGREHTGSVALLPVHIGGRVALVVWVDDERAVLDLKHVDPIVTLCLDSARALERLIVERKRRRKAADTASAAAAAMANMQPLEPGDITRRFAERRGVQVLRTLGRNAAEESAAPLPEPEPVPPPALPSTPPATPNPRETVTLPDPSQTPDSAPVAASPVIPMPPPAPEAIARARGPEPVVAASEFRAPVPRNEDDGAPSANDDSATRFARGGRIPIAVDVVGTLPPRMPPDERASSPPRGRVDPRREPDEPWRGGPSDEIEALLTDIVDRGTLSDSAAHVLMGAGERALTTLFRFFPGPTSFDRTNTRTRIPAVSDIGPLLRLVVMFRHSSGPHLLAELSSYDAERRYYATLCLGEVIHPAALQEIAARLFDPDYPTSIIAIEALRAYRRFPEFESVMRSLRAIVIDPLAPSDRRRSAANVLGEIRDAEAVPALLVALADRDGALAGIARRSLVVLARQDFGQDVAQWQQWWDRSAGYHRIEWLIAGLLHGEPTIRHEASEELKKLTGQFFGYYFNLPRRERERAHARYLDWWQREGRDHLARQP